jgi:hypothetical protein
MAKEMTFSLDIAGAGEAILQSMAADPANQAAQAISQRATMMAASMDKDPPSFSVFESVGTIKRGQRAIATVTANGNTARQIYIARQALLKAKDAGQLN